MPRYHELHRKDAMTSGTLTGTGFYDRTVNFLFRPKIKLRDGEKHALLWKDGGFVPGSYIGPGTHITDKLKEGVEPVSDVDRVAQAHDIRYSLAKNAKDQRQADIKMVNKLNNIRKNKTDNLFNITAGKLPIALKMKLEDWGLVKHDTFANIGGVDEKDIPLLQQKLHELELQGYGRR